MECCQCRQEKLNWLNSINFLCKSTNTTRAPFTEYKYSTYVPGEYNWQNPIQTHSGVSDSQHQILESFVSRDCSPESPVPMRGLSSLHSLLYAWCWRLTPVTLPAIQTNLFHDRKNHISDSLDVYAQELRTLFHKAYPSVQQLIRSRGTWSDNTK